MIAQHRQSMANPVEEVVEAEEDQESPVPVLHHLAGEDLLSVDLLA